MTSQSKLIGLGVWGEAAEQVIAGDVVTGLVAAGSTQATALSLGTADLAIFATVAASTGAILTSGSGGAKIIVRNGGANALLVYPPVGGYMNGALNTGLSVATTKNAMFISNDGINWYSIVSA